MKTSYVIKGLDLTPKPGKKYWKNCHREWREEFIYFMLLDRFHDNKKRHPIPYEERHCGFGNETQLSSTCGGTLSGVTSHLDYIQDLGCTALWLSPVFQNQLGSYHGYAINNYMEVDPRYGTKKDLEQLIEEAHKRDMRVFLDIVLHHSGDNWYYEGDYGCQYYNGIEFPFGGWRYDDLPQPAELRNPALYGRKGQIRNFDTYPETYEGDFCGLKAFRNDGSPEAEFIQELLTLIHCYWIREVDVDGFRLDAVKHLDEMMISRFCSSVREYAYSLGKKNFFLFGELIAGDAVHSRYMGPTLPVSRRDQNLYDGLNSVLDFQLWAMLEGVIKGKDSPERLIERYAALQQNALNRGEFGEFLVTFLDNHDQVGQSFRRRFGYEAAPEQIIAGVGFLLCALGTPCIYYGTEQGLEGHGYNDTLIRECLFNPDDDESNLLNSQSRIYKSIAKIAQFRKTSPALKFGRMFMREISSDERRFHLPECHRCTLAFSRILFDQEVLVVFNSSEAETKDECVLVDTVLNKDRKWMLPVYGIEDRIKIIHVGDEGDFSMSYVRLHLAPMQFMILKNY
ncbi:MAG TPA: alpha-amylase family glycosyl hydrolase [Saprospiraceae bacterium]|nr:alpha-amylase family glycosyl hydrolase [Saprospiraceae bacterium]